jgi:hypothetical protein
MSGHVSRRALGGDRSDCIRGLVSDGLPPATPMWQLEIYAVLFEPYRVLDWEGL